uniref:Uncharacterized protein n=1 Tax=Oryctolagus cuniculus TaxID=9986 RepID=A0A5F9CH36_RABIT
MAHLGLFTTFAVSIQDPASPQESEIPPSSQDHSCPQNLELFVCNGLGPHTPPSVGSQESVTFQEVAVDFMEEWPFLAGFLSEKAVHRPDAGELQQLTSLRYQVAPPSRSTGGHTPGRSPANAVTAGRPSTTPPH